MSSGDGGVVRRSDLFALRPVSEPDELAARTLALEAALEARDAFLAVAAHELRNPMTPMLGQVQLLLSAARRDGTSPQLLAGLERLERIVQHYIRRATTLLEVSRINTGGLRLEPREVDLSALVQGCTDSYAAAAERAGVALRTEVAPGVRARLDPLAVEQTVDNLISNALKYGYGKPVDVRLARDGGFARISVRDRGEGISEQDQARIFGRFEGAVGQRKHGGFGVGLWVASQLVEASGGRIGVASRPAEGSEFQVWLPLGVSGADGGPEGGMGA